ncbi:YybS family protein [uncultured Mitsuokella sp.]|uniref:YybS family protein n=1 Tax=uncultured Mitsuokella sp. TaxID=453120 RepID=UPI0025E8A84F|nr:YybS family protein [uncultured Mitsuokella sp.]
MTSHRITPLTESGLLSALTVILAMAAAYLPVIGMVAALVWALPVVVLIVRHGLRWGVMSVLVSGVIMALLLEPMLSLRMVLSFGPTGLMLGYAFRHQWSGAHAFGMTLVASVAGKLLTFGLLFLVTSVNPLNMQMDVMQQSFDQTFAVYEQMGLDKNAIAASKAQISEAMTYLNLLLPFIVGVMGLLDAGVAYIVSSRVLRRLGETVPQLPPFAEWRLPQFFLYLLGFALVGIYWGGSREIQPLYQAAFNLNMVAMGAGVIQGLSLMSYVMDRFRVGRVMRMFFYAFVLLGGVLVQILAFTGLFDMLFDYRRRFGQKKS